MHRTLIILMSIMLLLVAISCASKSGDSITATMPTTDSGTLTTSTNQVLGVWSAEINPDAKTFTVTPDVREASFHLPLTQYYPNVLKITGYGFTPNFWADIQLTHPFSTGQCRVDGFDTRVIAIIPANPDVSFNYPMLNVNANNSVLIDPDGYTSLYDYLGGSIPGNANPFRAYFKDQPYRVWSNAGVMTETQRWDMDFAGFGGPLQFKLVVDVSTNYPNPPHPVIDNAPEPIKIDAIIGPGLSQNGGGATVTVTLLDWQGQDTIGGVCVEAPDLFNGVVNLAYSALGPNPNEYVYTGVITNSLLASEGAYKILLAAWNQTTGIYGYNEFSVDVAESTSDSRWAVTWGHSSGTTGLDMVTDGQGNVYVTGRPHPTLSKFSTSSGALLWTRSWSATVVEYPNSEEKAGCSVGVDTSGNIYVTGWFINTVDFDPGPGEDWHISVGGQNAFLSQFDSQGNFLWVRTWNGTGHPFSSSSYGYGVATDNANNVYVTGCFTGVVDFDPGPGEDWHTALAYPEDRKDSFLSKFDQFGNFVWAKTWGGGSTDVGFGVATNSEKVYVVGYAESVVDFDPGPGENRQNSQGSFLSQFDTSGNFIWARTWCEYGNDVAIDPTGCVYVSGHFHDNSPVDFDPGPGEDWHTSNGYFDDLFITKFDSLGNFLWAETWGGEDYDEKICGVSTDSIGNVYTTGYFARTVDFDPGPGEDWHSSNGDEWVADIFLNKLDPSGNFLWVKTWGGSGEDGGCSIATDEFGNLYVTGYFTGVVDFDPGPGEDWHTSVGNGSNAFLSKFLSE